MNKKSITVEIKSTYYKIGIGFLVLSLFLWVILLIAPFTPFPTKIKAVIITGSIVLAEIMFWGGLLLVGKKAATKLKSYLNPRSWLNKQRKKGLEYDEE